DELALEIRLASVEAERLELCAGPWWSEAGSFPRPAERRHPARVVEPPRPHARREVAHESAYGMRAPDRDDVDPFLGEVPSEPSAERLDRGLVARPLHQEDPPC